MLNTLFIPGSIEDKCNNLPNLCVNIENGQCQDGLTCQCNPGFQNDGTGLNCIGNVSKLLRPLMVRTRPASL